MELNVECVILRTVKHISLAKEDKISTMNVVHLEGGLGGLMIVWTRKGQMICFVTNQSAQNVHDRRFHHNSNSKQQIVSNVHPKLM